MVSERRGVIDMAVINVVRRSFMTIKRNVFWVYVSIYHLQQLRLLSERLLTNNIVYRWRAIVGRVNDSLSEKTLRFCFILHFLHVWTWEIKTPDRAQIFHVWEYNTWDNTVPHRNISSQHVLSYVILFVSLCLPIQITPLKKISNKWPYYIIPKGDMKLNVFIFISRESCTFFIEPLEVQINKWAK